MYTCDESQLLVTATVVTELSQWLCHGDSTINIVVLIIIISTLTNYNQSQGMGPIGPSTSPKHADRPRLLPSGVFYTRACCYNGCSLFYIWNREIQGSQDSLCGPHSGLPQGRVLGHLERKFFKYSFSWYDSFIGTKVLGTFAPEERKFHGSECYTERKFLEPSLPRNENSTGVKVPRSECSMERKFHRSESSLYGLFAPGNESAEELKGLESSV